MANAPGIGRLGVPGGASSVAPGSTVVADKALRDQVNRLQTQLNQLAQSEKSAEAAIAKLPKTQITPDDIFNAENRGVFSGSGSLKTLGEGWWYIQESNTGVTGRPSGSKGDLLVYRRSVGSDGVAMMAFGRDREGPQVWGEYRAADNIGYSPWVKLSVTDTLSLTQIRTELEKEGWGPLPTPGGSGGTKPVELAKYYAGYDTAFPTQLDELTEYSTPRFTITRSDKTPERIFVLIPIAHASQVRGFEVSGGLEATWAFRDLTIGGQQYRAFYSPGAFYELSDTVSIMFV